MSRPAVAAGAAAMAVAAALRGGRIGELAKKAAGGAVSRSLDRAIAAVAPVWGLRRAEARLQRAALSGGYDAVAGGRTHRQYGGSGGTGDDHLDSRSLWDLRELCRDHERNNAVFTGMLDRIADNVLGERLGWTAASGSEAIDREVTDYVRQRMRSGCFTTGEGFQAGVRLALRSVLRDGDVLLAFTDDGQVEPIEADQLVTPRIDAAAAVSGVATIGRRTIVNGVETDADGIVTAYHAAKRRSYNARGWVATGETRRIPAADARLPKRKQRFSQSRGAPAFSAALSLIDKLDAYVDAEALAAQMNADWALFIQREAEADYRPMGGTDTQTDPNKSDDSTASTFDKLARHEPGMVYDGFPGEKLDFVESKRPGRQFDPYITTMSRLIGASAGLPVELVLIDFSKTTYTSGRMALLEARRTFRKLQAFATLEIAAPIVVRWIARGVAARQISPGGPNANPFQIAWKLPRWEWVDPFKEARANEVAIVKNRTKSRSAVIRDRGEEPEEVFDELEAEEKDLRRRGLLAAQSGQSGPSDTEAQRDREKTEGGR